METLSPQDVDSNEKTSEKSGTMANGERDDSRNDGVDEVEIVYPSGWRLVAIAIALVMSMFLVFSFCNTCAVGKTLC